MTCSVEASKPICVEVCSPFHVESPRVFFDAAGNVTGVQTPVRSASGTTWRTAWYPGKRMSARTEELIQAATAKRNKSDDLRLTGEK